MGWLKRSLKKLKRRITSKHLKRACERKYQDKALAEIEGLTNPEQIIETCLRNFRNDGYKILDKKGKGKLSRFTTIFYRYLYLSRNFYSRDKRFQAATLVHERVHHHQWRGVGRAKFAWRYADPMWRLIYECQAYRVSLIMLKRFRLRSPDKWRKDLSRKMPKSYVLGSLRDPQAAILKAVK